MIILLHPDASPEQRDELQAALQRLGVQTDDVAFGTRHALVASDAAAGGLPAGSIARMAGVDKVVPTGPRAPLAAATARPGGHLPPRPGRGLRKRRKKTHEWVQPVVAAKPKPDLPPVPEKITLSEGVTVKELAEKLERKSKDVIA